MVWRTRLSTKEGTVNVSLRISETAYRALQEDAKKRNISLNTIANQIFLAYAEWDRHLSRFEMLKISHPTFAHILKAATEEAIAEAGRVAGADVPPGVILSTKGELSVSSILDWMKRMGTYSNLIDYSEITHAGKTSVTLSHDLGPRWSLFLTSYFDSVFKSADKQVKFTQHPGSVTFEL